MQRSARALIAVLLGSLLVTCSRFDAPPAADESAQVTPQSEEEQTLYALGALVSRNLEVFALAPAEVPFVSPSMK